MIKETSQGVQNTAGMNLHSLINREYVKYFPNANQNMT
jgi:hypothetical protein